jgi:hypothetical protein
LIRSIFFQPENNKELHALYACCLVGLISLEIIVDDVFAYTFHTIWWLGYSPIATPDQSPGVLQIYYTYPDRVFVGQEFSVGVTLEYIKDDRALLDWLVFSRVSIGLKNYSSLSDYFSDPSRPRDGSQNIDDYPDDLVNISDNTSRLVSPGERYSYSFNITAPQIPGKYVIFPRWNAFYGPGTTVTNSFNWDLDSYYNQTDREFGVMTPDEIPPIEVLEKNQENNSENARLEVFINSPYSDIKPVEVIISNNEDARLAYSNFTNSSGYAFFDLPVNSTNTITVPKIIDIIPNEIRAVFVNWTDGYASRFHTNDTTKNITRVVDLQHDVDLVPMYKTQYYLSVESENGINSFDNNGTGWYDAGDPAQFAANTFRSVTSLYSFDHWNGTISSGESTGSSGVLTMDGPKAITAVWKFDYGYLGAYIGIITGGMTIFGAIHSRKHIFFRKFLGQHS